MLFNTSTVAWILLLLLLPSDPSFWQLLQRRFQRKVIPGVLQDVYDGQEYQIHTKPGGFLSEKYPANLSLMLNTDGVQLYNSSTTSIWPVWMVINELPPQARLVKS